MNTEKERAEFEAVFSVPPDVIWNEEHQHYGWVSHPRHDAPFNLQWEAWQAARAPQLEEIEGLREALVVFANKSNWLETLDVNAEVITWEHELIGEPWKFAQKAISDSLGDIESRIDAINERSRLRVENEELREALKLALEYWTRHKNQSTAWVKSAQSVLQKREQSND